MNAPTIYVFKETFLDANDLQKGMAEFGGKNHIFNYSITFVPERFRVAILDKKKGFIEGYFLFTARYSNKKEWEEYNSQPPVTTLTLV